MKAMSTLVLLLLSTSLFADSVAFWKVQKVRSNDSLNIREKSIHTSKKIGSIPYTEQCVKNHGCGKNIDLDSMLHMQEEEVAAFIAQAQEKWCYIEYKGTFGWVNGYYLTESTQTCK